MFVLPQIFFWKHSFSVLFTSFAALGFRPVFLAPLCSTAGTGNPSLVQPSDGLLQQTLLLWKPTLHLLKNVPCAGTWAAWHISRTMISQKELTWETEGYNRRLLCKQLWTFKMCLLCWQGWLPHSRLAEGSMYLSISCCIPLPGPLRMWFCVTPQLNMRPSKWSCFLALSSDSNWT